MQGEADFTVYIEGPNSGGCYTVNVQDGVVWHCFCGDVVAGGEEWGREEPLDYARTYGDMPKHAPMIDWLRARGLCS